jgi:hypothetical protein
MALYFIKIRAKAISFPWVAIAGMAVWIIKIGYQL